MICSPKKSRENNGATGASHPTKQMSISYKISGRCRASAPTSSLLNYSCLVGDDAFHRPAKLHKNQRRKNIIAPSDEGAVVALSRLGERKTICIFASSVSPSVFCFAKSTSLVRGRKGICCNIKGLPPPQNFVKFHGAPRAGHHTM